MDQNQSGMYQGVPAGLPRDPADFTSGSFGPLMPLVPMGVDVPDPMTGRPEPRRWQYPVGWNLPVGVPGAEGIKLTAFANLRAIADSYSVARACLSLRQNEILGLEWDIGPTDEAEKEMRGDDAAYKDFQNRRAELMAFFRRPDPNYHDYHTWMRAVLEDLFVTDAVALYLHPSRKPGKGVLGSDLAGIDCIDGTTIRPLLDLRGGTPVPPNPAWQQYLWGVPRVDLMDVILDSDIEGMRDAKVTDYRADQLLYLRYYPRNWTPYGFPPVEQALIPLMAGLAKQQFALQWFCYSDDTEVLTNEGWKLFPEVRGDELFATRAWDGSFEWQPSRGGKIHVFDYDGGELVHFQNRRVDLLVTPNHRMLTRYENGEHQSVNGEWHFERADFFLDRSTRYWELPMLAEWEGEDRSVMRLGDHEIPMDDFCRFVGLFLSEGWVRKDRGEVYISQYRTSKHFHEVEVALKATGLKWTYNEKTTKFQCFDASLIAWLRANIPGRAWEKRIPSELRELAPRYLAALWEGLLWGDGTVSKTGQIQYTTTSGQLAGDIQEITHKVGIVTQVLKRKLPANGRSRRQQYVLTINPRPTATMPRPFLERYDRKVYCPSTENGVVLVRRNGKATWCGNTEGSIPGLFLTAGPDINTPQQIATLQRALNSVAGDVGFKHKIIVLPPGSKAEPMKPTALADQFDQIVMQWVLMAFDVQPMELGLTSGSGEAGYSTPMGTGTGAAMIQHAVKERKSLMPLLMFLKRAIFDFIIRDVCKQTDMEWKWRGLNESPIDPVAQATQLKTLISTGLISVDEGRDELGRQPWGSELTSDPLFVSPTGAPMPIAQIEAIVEQQREAMQSPLVQPGAPQPSTTPPGPGAPGAPGAPQPPATPGAGQQAQKPSAPKPPPPPSNAPPPPTKPTSPVTPRRPGTPAHNAARSAAVRKPVAKITYSPALTKMAQAEMKVLRNQVRKGRPLATFEPRAIPESVFDAMVRKAALSGDWAAVEYGQEQLGGWEHVHRREAAITLQMQAITLPLGVSLRKFMRGKADQNEFVDKTLAGVSVAMSGVALAASQDVATTTHVGREDLNDEQGAEWDQTLNEMVVRRTEQQRPFLENWARDLAIAGGIHLANSVIAPAVNNRIALYGRALQSGYEEAYGNLVHLVQKFGMASNLPPDAVIQMTWHTSEGGRTCGLCEGRDGNVYTQDTLPGYPGEGGFGQLCEGGPMCKCFLTYAAISPSAGVQTLPVAATAVADLEKMALPMLEKRETDLPAEIDALIKSAHRVDVEREKLHMAMLLATIQKAHLQGE